MDLEASLYDQEGMEIGREWDLFGGQLLTFPETPISIDAPGSSVLQLEQPASDDGGTSSQVGDNVSLDTLQDSAWSYDVNVEGLDMELFGGTLETSLNSVEDFTLNWLDAHNEIKNFLNFNEKFVDGQLTSDDYALLSTININELSYEGKSESENLGIDSNIVFENLLEYSDIMEEEHSLENCMEANTGSKNVEEPGNYAIQACKPDLYDLPSWRHQQAASGKVASSHEEDNVDIGLLEGDDASMFKLLEDLEQENRSKEDAQYKIKNDLVGICSTEQELMMLDNTTKNDASFHCPVSTGKIIPAALTSLKIERIKTSSSISHDDIHSVKHITIKSTSQSGKVSESGASPVVIRIRKAVPVAPVSNKSRSTNALTMCPRRSAQIVSNHSSAPWSTSHATVDSTALIQDGSNASSHDSASILEDPHGKCESSKWIPKAAPAIRKESAAAQPHNAVDKLMERRMRKKEQNVRAALRYRQKKREEKGHALTEVEKLEMENEKLRDRADELTTEINYIKNLMAEIKSH